MYNYDFYILFLILNPVKLKVAEPVIVQNKPIAPDTRTESTSQVTSLHENLLRKVIKKPIKWNEKEV